MKRLLILAIAAVLVLGLAAATYAVDFSASGFVRVRSYMGMNALNPRAGLPPFIEPGPVVYFNDAYNDSEAWMDTRFRLRFAAKANDYATGVIYFEGDSTRWGEAAGTRNTGGFWNADRAAVELKQFYIDFKVPGLSDFAPTTIKAGVQGFSVRSHVLLFADGAGVETNTAAGPVKFNLYWYKPAEGADHRADDSDIYGAQVWVPGLLPVTPGGYVLYMNSNDYPLRAGTGTQQADLYWIGAYADGKIGPVGLQVDFVYSGGTVDATGAGVATGLADFDISGWCFFADAVYTLEMAMPLDIGFTGMYATGADLTDRDFDGYVIPPGSEEPYIGDWSIVYYASAINDGVRIANLGSGTQAAYGSAGGTWFAKIYAGVKPVDWMKVKAYAMYIGDTTDHGNTIGNAASTFNVATGAITYTDDSDIGIEVGAIIDFQIYKNLTYSIGAGYLFAGDALDTFDTVASAAAGVIVNDEPDNPWAVVSQLIFKF